MQIDSDLFILKSVFFFSQSGNGERPNRGWEWNDRSKNNCLLSFEILTNENRRSASSLHKYRTILDWEDNLFR